MPIDVSSVALFPLMFLLARVMFLLARAKHTHVSDRHFYSVCQDIFTLSASHFYSVCLTFLLCLPLSVACA